MNAPAVREGPGTKAGPARARGAVALSRLTLGQARMLAIVTGGAIGTLARAGLVEALPHRSDQWPWPTFIANLAGAFILGWLLTRLAERTAPTRHWRFFAGTGFCGALTTFSSFQVETLQLIRTGAVVLAVVYSLGSVAAGMALAVTGVMIARWGRHW